jgi:hypothetical protein
MFDMVTMDEVIDIRRELERPLVRFRSGIIKFSRDIQNSPWEKDFPLKAEEVFREHVEPAIMDLEDACQSNKFLLKLIPKLGTTGVATPSVIGLLVAEASHLPGIIAAGLGLSATVATIEAYKEWRKENQQIEGNQLYFYYKASKLLSN